MISAVASPTAHVVSGGGPKQNSGPLQKAGGLDWGRILLFAGLGAAAGFLLPVIPFGPIGGAVAGAALALLTK